MKDRDYEFFIERANKTRRELCQYMDVIPVYFSKEHKDMLLHCKIKLEKGVVAINPKFDKLITALRTAVDNEGSLDKEATSYDDIFDAYRLALKFTGYIIDYWLSLFVRHTAVKNYYYGKGKTDNIVFLIIAWP
jgi:hypothetical protein